MGQEQDRIIYKEICNRMQQKLHHAKQFICQKLI